MYSKRAGLILGFHGCDESVRDKIVSNGILNLNPSENSYDWLGNGTYFWENNLSRAFKYAEDLKNNPHKTKSKIIKPSVLGAIIDLGHCLDLLLRNLDCAVIQTIHQFNRDEGLAEFDTVRGVFLEGDELYPNAGFREKNHIQIAVRNPNCIKGFFIPRVLNRNHPKP